MSYVKYTEVEPKTELDKLLYEKFTFPGYIWLEVGDDRTFLGHRYLQIREDIENLNVTDDDIFLVSFPRSGNTWLCEMVWLIENDYDYEAARRLLNGRVLYVEGSNFFPNDEIYDKICKIDNHMNINYIKNEIPPRFLKTHLPWNLLPKKVRDNIVKPKMIFVSRNPKDSCVSLYHLTKSLQIVSGNMNEFCKLFLNNRVTYAPYWTHFYSYWNRRNQPNILHITYEEMKNNLQSVIIKVVNFLGRSIRKDQLLELEKHLKFSNMEKNFFSNGEIAMTEFRNIAKEICQKNNVKWSEYREKFLRKGKVGTYKEEMDPEIIKEFDLWIAENIKGTDLKFD